MTASSFDEYVDILGPDDTQAGRAQSGAKNARVKSDGPRALPAFIARPYALIKAIPDVGTYFGVLLIVVGFVLLAICWGKVAGLTNIAYQMPYLASAGLTGLGLIVCGIAFVSAASREKDAALRRGQMSELASTLRQLRLLLAEPEATSAAGPTDVPNAMELTTELAAILDAPLDDDAVVTVSRPVTVTGRGTQTRPRAAGAVKAARPATKAAGSGTRPTKTAKRVSQ